MSKPKALTSHRVVVKGFYFAWSAKDGKHKVAYEEHFILSPHEHRSHAQGALGHVLADKLLAKRLTELDPNFRGISTHEVSEHENIF